MEIQNYEQALQFIHGRTQFKKIPTLKRMRRLMQELGDPQKTLTMIHVTGTNGKGSTVAFLRSILMAAGNHVGTFTSPFITRFNERISLDNQPIDDQNLVTYTQRVKTIVDHLDQVLPEGGPTEFEIVTAIMFLYFRDVHPDVVIVEVGIGGLYDSTNIIVPAVSAITTVGYDHMNILGNTLTEIATQKAGIIKPNVPVVIGQLPNEALTVISADVQHKNATLIQPEVDYQVALLEHQGLMTQLEFSDAQVGREKLQISLFGDYQVQNAGVAVATVIAFWNRQSIPVDWSAIRRGVKTTRWPGRMELVNETPAIILDGAHNLPAMKALRATIEHNFSQRDVYLLVAMLADKQTHEMIDELRAIPGIHLVLTTFAGPKKQRPGASIEQLIADRPDKRQIQTVPTWQDGVTQLAHQLSGDDILIITGSLYFISDVRHYFKD